MTSPERRPRRVVMVAAVAENGVIGDHGDIPWEIPEDFAHFKAVTVGHPLIMGRTTFEGIGRPLPDRQSIVLTRRRDWTSPGVLTAATIADALALAADVDDETVNIGGGAAVYDAAMPFATHQILTRVHLRPDGDSRYPDVDGDDWDVTRTEPHLDHDPPWVIEWLTRRS